jgi:signal peptidase I
MARNPWRSGLWTAMLVVLMGGVWLTFAPTVAGGRSAYVIVAGASMEPTLRRGDLVIARQSADYQVGDIVTYRHPTVGPVIHRVIAVGAGRTTPGRQRVDRLVPSVDDEVLEAWIICRASVRC